MAMKDPKKRKDALASIPNVPQPEAPRAKERFTVTLPGPLIERMRNWCYWERSQLSNVTEEVFEAALAKVEKNNGGPFAERESELKAGRPIRAKR